MTIQEEKIFGTPRDMYANTVKDVLLSASGLLPGQIDVGLAHVAVTATQIGEKWHVFAIDPNNPPTTPDDALGAFIEDGEGEPLDQDRILKVAEGWLRCSQSVEWIPGQIIPVNDPTYPKNALGHILVRATEAATTEQ